MDTLLTKIEEELIKKKLLKTQRVNSGVGRSNVFGVVNRRCLPSDYSRFCWLRPYLYKLLLEFGERYINHPFTSITVNDNYPCLPHRDKGNVGESTVIAFGDYVGGELVLHTEEGLIKHNIKLQPITRDFKAVTHSVAPFKGNRYSLVYYNIACENLPPPSVRFENNEYLFYRGNSVCRGLDHPRKNKQTHK